MSDRIPGSSHSNPIWYGSYRIYIGEPDLHPSLSYSFVHDDFDGAEDAADHRSGHAKSLEEAKRAIDALEQENDQWQQKRNYSQSKNRPSSLPKKLRRLRLSAKRWQR